MKKKMIIMHSPVTCRQIDRETFAFEQKKTTIIQRFYLRLINEIKFHHRIVLLIFHRNI